MLKYSFTNILTYLLKCALEFRAGYNYL